MTNYEFEKRLDELKKAHVDTAVIEEAEKKEGLKSLKHNIDCIRHRIEHIQTSAIDIMTHMDSRSEFERGVADAMIDVMEVTADVCQKCCEVLTTETKQLFAKGGD